MVCWFKKNLKQEWLLGQKNAIYFDKTLFYFFIFF